MDMTDEAEPAEAPLLFYALSGGCQEVSVNFVRKVAIE